MADIIVDGRVRVSVFPTLAATTLNPTVAELNAGVTIQARLVPTGLEGFEATQAEVDNTSLASTFDTKLPGRKSYSGTGFVLKASDDAVDAVLAVMAEGTDFFVGIRDVLLESVAWAASQKLEVHPVRSGERQTMGRGEANSLLRIRVPLYIRAQPNKLAVVSAT